MQDATANRINEYLKSVKEEYPDVWRTMETLREEFLPEMKWPGWCYCPMAAAYAIASHGKKINLEQAHFVGMIGALAPWRLTKGIYRFDVDLFKALWETDIEKLPVDVVYNLEQWAIYIECPIDVSYGTKKLYGWFYHLEYDVNTDRTEMRFLLDIGSALIPFPLHVKDTVSEGFEAVLDAAEEMGFSVSESLDSSLTLPAEIKSIISVTLYLCSAEPDIQDEGGTDTQPAMPEARKTKRGLRIFPATRETVWNVGHKIGKTIRQSEEESGGWKVRPHIRKAHWHSYWVGKHDSPERRIILKWLPPTMVGESEIDAPTTIYKVNKKDIENE